MAFLKFWLESVGCTEKIERRRTQKARREINITRTKSRRKVARIENNRTQR